MNEQVTPAHIMQIGMGFWASKTLLSAVELGLFAELARGPLTGKEIETAVGMHPRATYDFLDALVALGLLERDGIGREARYSNTPETAHFLDRNGPLYVGGILEMANARLYPFWADLTEALKTGKPQNEIKHSGKPMFDELYSDPARLEQFMDAMSGCLSGELSGVRGQIWLQPISHARGHRRCNRPTFLHCCGTSPAHDLQHIRPCGCPAHRRASDQ